MATTTGTPQEWAEQDSTAWGEDPTPPVPPAGVCRAADAGEGGAEPLPGLLGAGHWTQGRRGAYGAGVPGLGCPLGASHP